MLGNDTLNVSNFGSYGRQGEAHKRFHLGFQWDVSSKSFKDLLLDLWGQWWWLKKHHQQQIHSHDHMA